MILHRDMLSAVMEFCRVNQVERGLVIIEDLSGCREVMSQSVKKLPQPNHFGGNRGHSYVLCFRTG